MPFVAQFTQFIRPNGEQRAIETDIENMAAEPHYKAMLAAGCRLTIEVIDHAHVSVCIEHKDGDFRHKILREGPDLQRGVEQMLLSFTPEKLADWLRAQAEPLDEDGLGEPDELVT